jgi:electron transfer flavoprotein beta subunit
LKRFVPRKGMGVDRMRDLHTIVCLKVVPKSEEVTVDRRTRTLDRSKARSEINGADLNALEAALAIKDANGGRVSLLSMGPPLFEPYLRLGLAMGADAAYLMSDRAFGGADTLATSYTLASGIRAIGSFDLVLCGEESSDGATGSVPPGIAEWLGVAQITYATYLQMLPRKRLIRGRRELRGGFEVVDAPLPCVVSVKQGANEPRFMDFDRWDWAMREAPLTVWTAADIGLEEDSLGLAGSATTVATVEAAPTAGRRHEFLAGTPQEEVDQLLQRIKQWISV